MIQTRVCGVMKSIRFFSVYFQMPWALCWFHWLWHEVIDHFIVCVVDLVLYFHGLLVQTSDQIRSVAQSSLTLCDPMNRSTPGLPVHHQLPEFTQTHVNRVSDAIQPSHPLSSPSPPAPNPSPLQYSCLENHHRQRSLAGFSPWGHKQSDVTEWLITKPDSTLILKL